MGCGINNFVMQFCRFFKKRKHCFDHSCIVHRTKLRKILYKEQNIFLNA